MSDDLPLIFAAYSPTPTAVFLSAAGTDHIQQFTIEGWAVAVTAGFQPVRPTSLVDAPAQVVDEKIIFGPTVVSVEAQTWSAKDLALIAQWQPRFVKVNCAFTGVEPSAIEAIAKSLSSLGLIMLATHWRDDNTFRIRSFNRIERLEALQPPEWSRLNFIACADERGAQAVTKIGRIHAVQEQRIAQLRITEAVHDEQIARLEAALIAAQNSPYFKTPS